jgi:hypothetical protein
VFLPEPHVRLRWVGFVPRRWQARYVRAFKDIEYQGIQLLSLRELRRHAVRAFGPSVRVAFPLASVYGRSAGIDRIMAAIERIPLVRTAALSIFPSHVLMAQKARAST